MQYHIEAEYYSLIHIISAFNVEISKHYIPTYTLDELEKYANSIEASDKDGPMFTVDRRPSVLDNKVYEVMHIIHKETKGELRLFGSDIPMPAGYKPVKIDEEKSDEEN